MSASAYSLPEKLALGTEALVALAHARLILHRTTPAEVLRRNADIPAQAARRLPALADSTAAERCERVGFAISRTALRLPWRADCLVQALAGQAMLRRRGIASTITIGTARHPDGRFEAHAWLVRGTAVILGGDISRFEPLLDPGAARPDTD